MTRLLIVESPAKARTISDMLGRDWRVMASFGHVRDLPAREIGVSRSDFSPSYVPTERGKSILSKLRGAMASCSEVFLATDPDREGEAIAWHLAQALRLKPGVYSRVSYNEITKAAIMRAINNPQKIDQHLVDAQQARRVLDRIVGYTVSPKLWDQSRISGLRLSAGRVQTPTLRLVVERDRAIANFKPTNHFGAALDVAHPALPFTATWLTKPFQKSEDEPYVLDRTVAERAAGVDQVRVKGCKDAVRVVNPPAPFTTSALQQAASAKLNLSPGDTMKLAQELFEKYHAISYHRTDSVHLADETVAAVREQARVKGYPLPDKPIRHTGKSKNAQEAHEAIRPTDMTAEAPHGVTGRALQLYTLIYNRTLASQLAPCVLDTRQITLVNMAKGEDAEAVFDYIAKGQVVREPGFTAITGAPKQTKLPAVEAGVILDVDEGRVLEQQTKPPARYTEGSLVRDLEKMGIGRPSTWASILDNIKSRDYITIKSGKVHSTPVGGALVDALSGMRFAQYGYTSKLEDALDEVAGGQLSYKAVVSTGWGDVDEDIVNKMGRLSIPEGAVQSASSGRGKPLAGKRRAPAGSGKSPKCPKCGSGMKKRKSVKGEFWGCSTYPDCRGTRNIK